MALIIVLEVGSHVRLTHYSLRYLLLTEMGMKAETKMSAMLPWLRTAVVASRMASEMSRPGVGVRVRVRVRARARVRVRIRLGFLG